MILGGRKNQPVPSQDLVGPMLGQDLITAIRIHFDGRCLALASLSRDFNTHAFVGPGKRRLRPDRGSTEGQAHGSDDENSSYGVDRSDMASHS